MATGDAPDGGSGGTLGAKLVAIGSTRAFWVLAAAFFACGVTTTGFMETHIVAIAVHRGMTEQTGALAFSLLSAFNGIGMVSRRPPHHTQGRA